MHSYEWPKWEGYHLIGTGIHEMIDRSPGGIILLSRSSLG